MQAHRVVEGIERTAARRFVRLPRGLLRRIVGAAVLSPEGFALDVQSQALLWLMRARGEPEMYDADLTRSRLRLDRSARILEPKSAAPVRAVDRTVPGAEGPRTCRVYTPAAARDASSPGVLWLHGGGFVLGSIASHDGVCRALADAAGIAVVSLDYRLAPEHRFPAGLEDAIAATRWLLEHGDHLGISPGALAVGGDSAGGNLAAGVAQALRGERRRPAFQALVYPPTDATRREPSHRHFRKGFILTADAIGWFLDHYVSDPALVVDPRVSPVLAADVSGLPPALVVTAGFDPLRDEAVLYARRMSEAGVDVEAICSEGSMHGFLNTAGGLDESARLLRLVADRLRRRLFGILRALP